MSEFNRRRFLQFAGAASLAPMIPALPARAAVVPVGGSTSQMLWASMSKRAATAPAVAGLTRTMGISNAAAHGVFSKLVQANVVAAQSAANLTRAVNGAPGVLNPMPAEPVANAPSVKVDLVKFLTEDPEQSNLDEAIEPNENEDMEHIASEQ